MMFEQVLDETVVVHSISSLQGSNRYYKPFKLPSFSNGYILRVTVSQVNQKSSPLLSNILSLLSSNPYVTGAILVSKLIQPSNTGDNIDVFIIYGADNTQNFMNKNAFQFIYQNLNTVSMNTYIEALPNKEGYLCLRNMNPLKGLTVHVEMVAEIGWDKNIKQKLYNELKEKMESENKYSTDEIKLFCECFVKTITSKDIKEVKNMLDDERKDWIKEIANTCKTKAGIPK